MDNRLLKQLGFTDKEADVFLTVLQHGKITPANAAKITGISRPTIYSVAKSLLKKGVLVEDLAGKGRYLVAQPLEEAEEEILRKDRDELQNKERLARKVITELSGLANNVNYSIPKIRFVEEDALEAFLYKQLSLWNKSAKKIDGICWGFQDHTLVENYPSWINYFWKQAGTDIGVKLFTNESAVEKKMKGKHKKREIKFLSESSSFTATTWVTGEYIVMIITRQRPHYLVEIYDTTLAQNMREMFKNMWAKNI